MQTSLCRTANRPDWLDHGVGDHRHPHRAPPGLRYERLFPRCVLTNFSELVMLFEIANKNKFPFPVQSNAPVGLMKHPTISRFFSNFFFHYIFQVWVNIPSFYNKFPNGKTARIACLAFPWPNLSNLSWTKRFCWPWSTPWNSNRDSASVIG